MTIRRVERGEWRGFCIRVSRECIGKHAIIEVMSLEFGCQVQARRVPMIAMVFDPRSDVLELLVGDIDHLIRSPRELYVDDTPFGVVTLQIVGADGVRQIVTLQDPLMLPAPHERPEARS